MATDFKLWVREAMASADAGLQALQVALVTRAGEHAASIMPGFTHLQTAQPVTLGHHLLAYYEMAARDRSRFADAHARANQSPLGAAALAGTGFPIDRQATAVALGFAEPTRNSLDSVSDRDFALDYLMAATQTALHLSRLAEELIIWASQPFGFVHRHLPIMVIRPYLDSPCSVLRVVFSLSCHDVTPKNSITLSWLLPESAIKSSKSVYHTAS